MEVKEKIIEETRDEHAGPTSLHPIASPALSSKLYEFVQQALIYKQLRKGINETLKLISKDAVEAVIMAGDAQPAELLAPLPQLCEEKSIPYCYVPHAASLGRACGIKRPTLCCCIVHDPKSTLKAQIQAMKDEIEKLFYN